MSQIKMVASILLHKILLTFLQQRHVRNALMTLDFVFTIMHYVILHHFMIMLSCDSVSSHALDFCVLQVIINFLAAIVLADFRLLYVDLALPGLVQSVSNIKSHKKVF